MPEFRPWPKIARLNRDIIITEKVDGTNAAIGIERVCGEPMCDADCALTVYAQSRSSIITPERDNFGFAAWVAANETMLRDTLGRGLHFGEWWGGNIQRGYGQKHKTFSLFNVKRFGPALHRGGYNGLSLDDGTVLDIVPVLYEGPFSQLAIDMALNNLRTQGSVAAPGFMKPEGIVVYHTAANVSFKVTLEGDSQPKGKTE